MWYLFPAGEEEVEEEEEEEASWIVVTVRPKRTLLQRRASHPKDPRYQGECSRVSPGRQRRPCCARETNRAVAAQLFAVSVVCICVCVSETRLDEHAIT